MYICIPSQLFSKLKRLGVTRLVLQLSEISSACLPRLHSICIQKFKFVSLQVKRIYTSSSYNQLMYNKSGMLSILLPISSDEVVQKSRDFCYPKFLPRTLSSSSSKYEEVVLGIHAFILHFEILSNQSVYCTDPNYYK